MLVSRQQAGQTVSCTCGASLEVPALLRLIKLPRAPEPDAAESTGGSWGLRHRLLLLGTVVFLLALTFTVVLVLVFPAPPQKFSPPPEQIREEAAAFLPREAWLVWQRLERSDVNALYLRDQLAFKEAVVRYEDEVFKYQLGIAVLLLFCAVGVGVAVVGLLQKPPP